MQRGARAKLTDVRLNAQLSEGRPVINGNVHLREENDAKLYREHVYLCTQRLTKLCHRLGAISSDATDRFVRHGSSAAFIREHVIDDIACRPVFFWQSVEGVRIGTVASATDTQAPMRSVESLAGCIILAAAMAPASPLHVPHEPWHVCPRTARQLLLKAAAIAASTCGRSIVLYVKNHVEGWEDDGVGLALPEAAPIATARKRVRFRV